MSARMASVEVPRNGRVPSLTLGPVPLLPASDRASPLYLAILVQTVVVGRRLRDRTAEAGLGRRATVLPAGDPPPGWTGRGGPRYGRGGTRQRAPLSFPDADVVLRAEALGGLPEVHDDHPAWGRCSLLTPPSGPTGSWRPVNRPFGSGTAHLPAANRSGGSAHALAAASGSDRQARWSASHPPSCLAPAENLFALQQQVKTGNASAPPSVHAHV